jgi:hypothetical protein
MLFLRACGASESEPRLLPSASRSDEPLFFELGRIEPRRRASIAASLLRSAPRARMRDYTRALRALVAGKEVDRARVLDADARYVARYSGAFVDAKRACIASMDVGALESRREVVSRFFGVDVVPTNLAAFVGRNKARMLGDSEIAEIGSEGAAGRPSWCGRATKGYTPIDLPAEKMWHELLRAAGVDVAHQAASDPPSEAPSEAQRLDRTARQAVERVSCAPTLAAVVSRSRLPARALGRMFATLGLDVEDAREAVRIHLTTWRDVNAADAAAVAYLANKAL